MTDWIYCATQQQVDAHHTQKLLIRGQAIWCQPPGLRPWPEGPAPMPRERLWLVWRDEEVVTELFLLGAGRLVASPRPGVRFGSPVLWTNADEPGLRQAAEELGYTGPTNMAFFKLKDPVLPGGDGPLAIENINQLNNNLNRAEQEAVEMLGALLPVL